MLTTNQLKGQVGNKELVMIKTIQGAPLCTACYCLNQWLLNWVARYTVQ